MNTTPRQPDQVMAAAALERLDAHARHDSGVVADLLQAWWNTGSCGAFDLTSRWALDTDIVADMTTVFGLIGCVHRDPRQPGLRGRVQGHRAGFAAGAR